MSRLMMSLTLVSSVAVAGPSSLELTAPAVVFTGVPATFTVQGPVAPGGYGLVVSPEGASGPPYCPAPLRNTCMDLATPAQVASLARFTPSHHVFTPTPPLGTPAGWYQVQAGGLAGGVPVLSTVQTVELIDSCTTLAAVWPAHGDSGVDIHALPILTFDSPTAALWSVELLQDGVPVATQVFSAGSSLRSNSLVVPDAPLAFDTAYTMAITDPCGGTTSHGFTTRPNAVDGFGSAFTLTFSGATLPNGWTATSGTGFDVGQFDGMFLYEIQPEPTDGSPWVAYQTLRDTITGDQAPCAPMNVFDVSWVSDDTLAIDSPDWGTVTSGTTQLVGGGARLLVTYAPGTAVPVQARMDLAVVPPDPVAACAQVACGPCLNDEVGTCMRFDMADLGITAVPSGLDPNLVCTQP